MRVREQGANAPRSPLRLAACRLAILAIGITAGASLADETSEKPETEKKRVVIECVPNFDLKVVNGGTVVGPLGEAMDGSRYIPRLTLGDKKRKIVIENYDFRLIVLDKKKTYRFVLTEDDKGRLRVAEVWHDGKRLDIGMMFQAIRQRAADSLQDGILPSGPPSPKLQNSLSAG